MSCRNRSTSSFRSRLWMKNGPCRAPSVLLAAHVGTASHGGAIRLPCAPAARPHLAASHSDPAPAADFNKNARRDSPVERSWVSSMAGILRQPNPPAPRQMNNYLIYKSEL